MLGRGLKDQREYNVAQQQQEQKDDDNAMAWAYQLEPDPFLDDCGYKPLQPLQPPPPPQQLLPLVLRKKKKNKKKS